MNKTAIKNFAVWARRKLISDITYKAGMIGITENGIADPLPQSTGDLQFFDIGTKNYAEVSGIEIKQRNALVSAIRSKERSSNYKTAFQNVIEEVAYTWFNRLIAVRFMEVNDYLLSRVRVLSSENPAKNEPDFVTTPFDTDLEFTPYEQDRILQLKDENKLDELFRMLFIKQCNKFNEILPELFEKTDDYSELLLTISFTDKDGIVYHLVHDIAEDDFNVSKEGQVEIIGWMYQFYNVDPKADIDQKVKKGIKVSEFDIAAKTQIFTPDWVVRYMLDNSLGRLWLDGHPDSNIATKLLYLVDDANVNAQTNDLTNIRTEDIKVIDPCMGSGHMLVYAFELLMHIYEAQGYTPKEAAQSILCNNLYGMDIDDRAYQLAYFSVLMKARQYNRRVLTSGVSPNLCSIQKSKALSASVIEKFEGFKGIIEKLQTLYRDAKDLGSIINVDISFMDLQSLEDRATEILANDYDANIMDIIDKDEISRCLIPLIKQTKLLCQKYDVVVTNPPYLGNGDMNNKLSDYIQDHYTVAKSDLYSVFMLKCRSMLKKNRYQAMVTMQSWMNLGAFEKLREFVCTNTDIVTLWHLDDTLLGIAYQTAAFVLRNTKSAQYVGKYFFASKESYSKNERNMYDTLVTPYLSCQDSYLSLAGTPIAYSLGSKCIDSYTKAELLSKELVTREGMTTGNNDRFLRLWHEVASSGVHKKWFPYNKGGEYRKWYGNDEYYVLWENDGIDIRNFKDESTGRIRSHNYNGEYAFRKGITWSAFSSRGATFRYSDEKFLFDSKGSKGFCDDSLLMYILAFLNSSTGEKYLSYFAGAKDKKPGHIISLPYIKNDECFDRACELAEECVALSKEDWDSFETSWDFAKHPLVPLTHGLLEEQYSVWSDECSLRFERLKTNEEKLNKIFIDVYGVSGEVCSTVDDKDVTVSRVDKTRDIKSLISYAVGCMFGRYSLDQSGLVCANKEINIQDYSSFLPDIDNCIPITDEDYFEDDIVGRFVQFIKIVYGEETLEENLDFIANALGNKGNTSREVIRNYFLNDFIKDHIKIYQKRPIYWLFDSGKQNGFKGLVYMHRWNDDTVGNLRVEYLHRMQRVYEKEIERMQDTIDHTQGREQTAAQKRKEKLVNQLKEAKDYDAKIAHIALARVDIDLDDGVKVNYEKVQKGQDGKNLGILAKI